MNGSRPCRVLHVVGAMNRGGVETWLMHVLRRSDPTRLQHDFVVHTNAPAAYDDEIRRLGARLFPIPEYRQPIRYVRQLRQLLRQHGPYDVVHSHVHHFSGLVLRVARQESVPCRIAHSHNDTTRVEVQAGLVRRGYLSLMKRWIRSYATSRLAVSHEAARSLVDGEQEASTEWRVLYCGHDFGPFRVETDRASVRRELGLPSEGLVVGHVGRFDAQKNHVFLIQIARELVHREPSTRLLLIGDGPLRASMQQQVDALGFRERVVFAGVRPDVPKLLIGAVDVFVFPSTHEGLPLTCTEAQAAGIPLVISDVITRELDVLPQLVTRLSLSESAARWAETCLHVAHTSTHDRMEGLATLERSVFSIHTCLRSLEGIYMNPSALEFPMKSHVPSCV